MSVKQYIKINLILGQNLGFILAIMEELSGA